jgi:multidrug efflux pump subunit AcrB
MERLSRLLLVMGICWLFLGSRISLLVGLGVPFSLAGTFACWTTGNTLNISVLLGIVIVLGMLVDDAVVMVEAIYYRMQRGADGAGRGARRAARGGAPVLRRSPPPWPPSCR